MPAAAQPRPPAPPGGDTPSLGRGWTALEAGRADEAAIIARSALEQAPDSQAALVLLLSALSQQDPVDALDAYEQWRSRTGQSSPHLAAVIGDGVLRALTSPDGGDSSLRLTAAELLVRYRVLGARAVLARVAAAEGRAGLVALARSGDERAAQMVVGSLGDLQGSAKVGAIGGLGLAVTTVPGATDALIAATSDEDEMVRAAAIDALRRSGDPSLAAAIRPLLNDRAGVVRHAAALALVALGDPAGEPLAEALLASGVPDHVLTAAEALASDQARWRSRVEPLLRTEDPLDRLRAARLLYDVATPEAEAELVGALASANPAIREEASRALGGAGLSVGQSTLRQMLGDSSGWVRLAAARALLDAATQPL